MTPKPTDSRELGRYFALAQVGLEMVVPIAIGVYLDHTLGWSPWGVVVGAILGLVGGLAHLIHHARKAERAAGGPGAGKKPGSE